MLEILSRRELRVDAPDAPGATQHRILSAASGLVRRQGRLYVVADDEHHLAVLDATSGRGRWLRLFDGELPGPPALPEARKAVKPDLETLIELPAGLLAGPSTGLSASSDLPWGALLALGSGSRPNRQRGVLVPFNALGEPAGAPRQIDLAPWYAPLRLLLGELNIEGGVLLGHDFLLLQRAHQGGSRNLCVRYAWHDVWPWLLGRSAAAPQALGSTAYELGRIEGIALGFTDAAALPGGAWVFSAVAEATHDNYHDGACAGSALGLVAADGTVRSLQRLVGRWKVEGIAATPRGDGAAFDLTLVTDADDRARPASCLEVRMSL